MDGARGGQNSTWGTNLLCGQDKPGAGPQTTGGTVCAQAAGRPGHKEEPTRAGAAQGSAESRVDSSAGEQEAGISLQEAESKSSTWWEVPLLSLGPPGTRHTPPHTPTWGSLGRARTPPRPSETENTQKKRELQEANHASWFQSCS